MPIKELKLFVTAHLHLLSTLMLQLKILLTALLPNLEIPPFNRMDLNLIHSMQLELIIMETPAMLPLLLSMDKILLMMHQ